LIHGHKSGQDSKNTGFIDLEAREAAFLADESARFDLLHQNVREWSDDRARDFQLNHDVAAVLDAREAAEDAGRLLGCGSYLLLRGYLQTANLRLREGIFCKLRACRACARIRAAQTGDVYTAKTMELIRQSYEPGQRPLVPMMFTTTVPASKSLIEQLELLVQSLRSMNQLRHNSKKQGRKHSEWGTVKHLAVAIEIKRSSSDPAAWHCHAHGVGLVSDMLNLDLIHREWKAISGASHRPDVRLLTSGRLLLRSREAFHKESFRALLRKDLKEVFKYSVKFGDMTPEDIAEIFLVTRRRRLLFGWNGFNGCKVPEELTDQTQDPGAWFDYHFGRDANRKPRLFRIRQGDETSVGVWDYLKGNSDENERTEGQERQE
jgi:hypothetical protein